MNVQCRTLTHGQRLEQFDVDLSDHVMSCCKYNDSVIVFLSKYQSLCYYHTKKKFFCGGGVLCVSNNR